MIMIIISTDRNYSSCSLIAGKTKINDNDSNNNTDSGNTTNDSNKLFVSFMLTPDTQLQ